MADIEIPTVAYYLVLLSPGSAYAEAERHYEAHIAFIDGMAAAGVVLLGGEFGAAIDGAEAAYLLRTETQAEAEAWAVRDPLLSSGAYRARVIAWNLVGIAPRAIDPRLTAG